MGMKRRVEHGAPSGGWEGLTEFKLEPSLTKSFSPLTSARVREIEQALQAELPAGYRHLLETYGACRFVDDVECEAIDTMPATIAPDNRVGLNFFYGMREQENEVLFWRDEGFAGRIPSELLTIGQDGTYRQLCIGISGKYRGRIYLWDRYDELLTDENYLKEHGKPRPPEVSFANVYLLANSFEEFIGKLELFVDDDDE